MKSIHDEKTFRQALKRLAAAPDKAELEFAFMGPKHWVDEQADAVARTVLRIYWKTHTTPKLAFRREAEYGTESGGFYPTGTYSTVRIIIQKDAATGQ